uniref:Phospholipid-transporting ATPase 1 isoform X2 n=1 Tax=Rhizophora mucronata TaxID=61149 RepID=A0A2P2MSH4_RHIMU
MDGKMVLNAIQLDINKSLIDAHYYKIFTDLLIDITFQNGRGRGFRGLSSRGKGNVAERCVCNVVACKNQLH